MLTIYGKLIDCVVSNRPIFYLNTVVNKANAMHTDRQTLIWQPVALEVSKRDVAGVSLNEEIGNIISDRIFFDISCSISGGTSTRMN